MPVALLALAGVGLSCRDTVAPVPIFQPGIRQDAAPPPFSATFAVSNPNDPKDSMALNAFPERRKVRVTLTGNLTATHKTNGGTRTTTPSGFSSGTSSDCTGRIYVTYAGTSQSYQPLCGTTGTFTGEIVAQGQGKVFRDSFGGAGGWRCDNWPYDFCWTFSGSQQVRVEVIDYPGAIDAYDGSTKKTTIPTAKSLWFAWTPVPNQNDIPRETYNWWFVTADSNRTIPNAVPYGYDAQWGSVPKSGTMYVNVKINGIQKTLSQYIHVGPPTITMSASPNPVPAGNSVRFESAVRPQGTIVTDVHWIWVPAGDGPVALRSSTSLRFDRSRQNATSLPLAISSNISSGIEEVCFGGSLVCTHTPQTAGTMRVEANLNGAPAFAEQPITLTAPQEKIAVNCAQVRRRESMSCVASSAIPGATLRVTGWRFESSQPEAPFVLDREDQPTALDWTGPALLSGTVKVTGTVGGASTTGTATMTVDDNPFTSTIPLYQQTLVRRLPDPPTTQHELGETRWSWTERGTTIKDAPSGPNKGLTYYIDIPFELYFEVEINDPAFSPTGTFALWQPVSRTTIGGVPYCPRTDMLASKSMVIAHEGTTRNDQNSHVQTYTRAFEYLSRVRMARYTSAHGGENTEQYRQDQITLIALGAKNESDLITHGPTTNPFHMDCEFNFDPTRVF